MKADKVKIRIVGSMENCERILSLLKPLASVWGKRRLFKARKFKRDPKDNPYSHIFGTAEMAVYVEMFVRERIKKEG